MAYATAHAPLVYYAPPSKPAALRQVRLASLDPLRKFAQGAGTALLGFAGMNNMTGAAGVSPAGAPMISDFTTIDGFTQAVLEGRLTGPAQLIAGAFLFLAAGRCTARLLGLVAGMGLIYLYLNGLTFADALRMASGLGERVSAAFAAFQNAGEPASAAG